MEKEEEEDQIRKAIEASEQLEKFKKSQREREIDEEEEMIR